MHALILCLALSISSAGDPADVVVAPRPDPDRAARYDAAVRERESIQQAILDGLQFLADSQQDDGSWGTGLRTRGLEVYAKVPGSLDSFKTATTALAVMAFQEMGGEQSPHPEIYRKGLEWLKRDGRVRRDQKDLMYNVWAHTYALQALSREIKAGNQDTKVRQAAEYHLRKMLAFETFVGGWNYYDFVAGTQRPSMDPTSFSTAAGLVALHEAREAGLEVPEGVFRRALARLREARRPDGAFLYDTGNRYVPHAPFNKWEGAAARSQACAYALWLLEVDGFDVETLSDTLTKLQENWHYLNIARKRPRPHEALYQNSGYYYYFGMYYAGLEVAALPAGPERLQHAENVRKMVMPFQEADGSWWDFAMWDYHKPYGTAYSVLTLQQLQKATAE